MLNPVIHELNITVYCPPNKEFNSNQILSLLKSSKIILESRPNQQFFSTSLKCKIEDIILGHLDLNETSLIRKHLESDYYIDSNITILNFNFNTIENVNTISAKIIFKFNRDLFNKNLHENWESPSSQKKDPIHFVDEKYLSSISNSIKTFDQKYLLDKYDMYLVLRSSHGNSGMKWEYEKVFILIYESYYIGNRENSRSNYKDIFLASNDIAKVNAIKRLDKRNSKYFYNLDNKIKKHCMPENVQLKTKKVRNYFKPIFTDLEKNARFSSPYIKEIMNNPKYINNQLP